MKIGVIDIGSNTIKLDIFKVTGKSFINVSAASLRGALAKHTMNGYLTEEGYTSLKNILVKFLVDAECAGCEKTLVFATQSLRNISNAEDVRKRISGELGAEIDIISGDMEAMCSFSALCDCIDGDERGIMGDMGGGSLELVSFSCKSANSLCSLPLGALRVRETLQCDIVPTAEQRRRIREYTVSQLADVGIKKEKNLYIIGGTARAIFSSVFRGESSVSVSEAAVTYDSMCAEGEKTKQLLLCEIPKRADSFMTGYAVFNAVAEYFGCEEIRLCAKGVRDGYLKMKLENEV